MARAKGASEAVLQPEAVFNETDEDMPPPLTDDEAKDILDNGCLLAVTDNGESGGTCKGEYLPMDAAAADLRGALPATMPMVQHVFFSSTAARIRAYYDAFVTVRHMAPTLRDPDSPEICPTNAYFKLFRWRPTCAHLVAHQPQPQSQYFPGIHNPLERAPT